jgi:DNA replication protein DnaC
MRKLEEILPRGNVTSLASTAASSSSVSSPDAGACELCRGAKFVRVNVPLDHPDFGQAVPCRCAKHESASERGERLLRYSNIGPLARLTFRNLIARGRSPGGRDQEQYGRCVEDARAFAESPEGWIVLSGASGCGKTHIAAAIVNRVLERGEAALFVVVPDLLDHLRSAYQPGADVGYDELFERVRNAPVLVLDDLGTQAPTQWAQEKLFQLINYRFNARLPMVVTTNLAPEQLDERLRTRLTDTSVARVYSLEPARSSAISALDVLDRPLMRDMTFESFEFRGVHLQMEDRKRLENAYRQALAFSEAPAGWLLFMGSHGTGKTHLAAAIANYRRARGDVVCFVDVAELVEYLRETQAGDESSERNVAFQQMRDAPLLVLDDLTSWGKDRLFSVLNYRYTRRLPTVVTTALTLDELGPRLASRLLDHAVCSQIVLDAAPHFEAPQPKRGRAPRARR